MEKGKKIVFKTRSFPKVSETFVVSNIVAALQQGYEVKILAQKKSTIAQSSQKELITKYQMLEKTTELRKPIRKIKLFLFGCFCFLQPTVCYYFWKLSMSLGFLNFNMLYDLYYLEPHRKAQVFHVHFADLAKEFALFKKIGFLKSKLLVTFHGYDAFYKDEIAKRQLEQQYQLLFQIADRITVNTLFLRDQVLSLGCPSGKLAVVPVGIDINYFSPIIIPKTYIRGNLIHLVSVGRLIELKGHEYGIRSVNELVENGCNVFYTIIGEGPMKSKLEALIKELGLEDNIRLYGKGSQDEIKVILEQSNIFLMTSIKGEDSREEAQGVVTIEAQAMGLPVVAFASGGVPETITESTGVLVPKKDYKAMALAVQAIIERPERYSTMSKAARDWVIKKYSLNIMVSSYYQDL